jgi:DNA-3-methyladenine glycosylase
MSAPLPQTFYARSPRDVAPDLLGRRLVRLWHGRRLSGIIVETEAYGAAGLPDLACHADRANGGRPTPRTAVMFGPPGHAYVYFTYGMHWMFNVVTGQEGEASAVLIRALQPDEGAEEMVGHRRGRPYAELTNGPAKLTQALQIDKKYNQANLCRPDGVIWIEQGTRIPSVEIAAGPRVGLGKTPEPWLSKPWRYWIRNNPFVS